MRLLPALALTLAACAPGMAAKPVSVQLLASRLTVTFTDGTRCEAKAEFAGRLQEGTLPNCPHPTRYSVDATARPNRISDAIASLFTALDLGDTLSPQASVTLTTETGRSMTFVSPKAAD